MHDVHFKYSVETLLRQGGKRLRDFAARVFGKLSTRFYTNRTSFVVED